ncbi:hypothetical protein [Streptomyces sp. TR06-5]|uniref:hypothetical protein n=1 Tax=unclassified Streptomyces TaxID=2593676 RepID=UPI0039A30E7B
MTYDKVDNWENMKTGLTIGAFSPVSLSQSGPASLSVQQLLLRRWWGKSWRHVRLF